MGNTVPKSMQQQQADPENGLFPSGMTPAMRKYRPKKAPPKKEYESSYKQGDWTPLRKKKEKPPPLVRTKKMCEPMEPYPDPFIGGYALPNLVEVDLRRDMPVTEILAEPEPEPEIEPEPEPEPEPQPEPEPVQEPLQIPLPGVMPVMPPLITEYIPVVKKTDTFTKFERAWISILILSIIIAVAARMLIRPKHHPPEDLFIFTQEIVPNFYAGQIYAFTEHPQNEVIPSCEHFLERWDHFPKQMDNYTMHNEIDIRLFPEYCGNFSYYPPTNPLDDTMYNSLLFLSNETATHIGGITLHAADMNECKIASGFSQTSNEIVFEGTTDKLDCEALTHGAIFSCQFSCNFTGAPTQTETTTTAAPNTADPCLSVGVTPC